MKKFLGVLLGILIILVSIASAIVSTGLTIEYFTSLVNGEVVTYVVIGFIVLLQCMVLIGSISKGIVYERTPQHYYTIQRFTNICFILSVLSTISFFNQFSKIERIEVIKDILNFVPFLNLHNNEWLVMNLTNMSLIWISCIVLDSMSMFFPSIGSDLITGISTKEKIILEKGYIGKLFSLITFLPKKWIDDKCNQLGILETKKGDYMETCNQVEDIDYMETKKVEDMETLDDYVFSKCNQVEDKTRLQTKTEQKQENHDTLYEDFQKTEQTQETEKQAQTETKQSIQVSDIACNQGNQYSNEDITKHVIKKPLQSGDTKKVEEVGDKKSLQSEDITSHDTIENIIKKIDDYIIKNYNIGDKINVTKVKTEFGFKKHDRRWNDKVRDNLKSIAKNENNRFYRVKLSDQLKIVK